MEHSTDNPPLSAVQQCVVNALAAGSTLTDAAEAYNVHRVTVYRWMKNCKPFAAALHRARAEFVLARRDDLHHLSNRALETLLAILDNPKSSPAVLLRTAMFILQRPQLPKIGWSMPEPASDPDAEKLLDSAIIEQDYANLPGLCNIENDDDYDIEADQPAPAEAAPPSADVTPCNTMQHDSQICDDVAPSTTPRQGLRHCPVPPDVLEALETIESVEALLHPKTEPEDNLAEANENDTEEILT
jgi:hypothetical protein